MSRWAPEAAERLQAAAMELFAEKGFADTTVPQITQRAGLTTRTFFRYFADKREVLFVGENELPEVVARVFAQAPADLAPLDVVVHGLRTVVSPRIQEYHAYFRARREIVESDAGLREREAHKLASLARAGAVGFASRGLPPLQADIAGSLAVAIYDAAFNLWLDGEDTVPFGDAVTSAADAAGAVASRPSPGPRSRGAARKT
jgi:AcrR family transcriptional regulator